MEYSSNSMSASKPERAGNRWVIRSAATGRFVESQATLKKAVARARVLASNKNPAAVVDSEAGPDSVRKVYVASPRNAQTLPRFKGRLSRERIQNAIAKVRIARSIAAGE